GDSYFTSDQYDTVIYESRTGLIPVKGAGFRGIFGGEGWDGMWTDMSEIVRPTRDGIHGREYISTEVDIGGTPPCLDFSKSGQIENSPRNLTLPIPLLFDLPPQNSMQKSIVDSLCGAAEQLQTLALVPLSYILQNRLQGKHIVPLVNSEDVGTLEKL